MADSSIVSRPLADMTYKELKNIAMLLSLPANLKRSVMRTLIQARKDGREELVQRLLMTHREQRCRNRPTGSDNRNHRLTPKEIYKMRFTELKSQFNHSFFNTTTLKEG
uniref:Uncharacterized protein n=1 Tax=Timema douglasi TaxID=61478 RepID=A0A7R8VZS4_TIMDO|nr:unnamed protein product [Timema douglasi]